MEDRLARLEDTVEALRSAVQSLQQRIDALEAASPPAAITPAAVAGSATRPWSKAVATGLAGSDPHDPIVVLSLTGRLLLVLAGGFFLRAMTEAGLLAPQAGVSLAFVYGTAWLALADRATRRQQTLNAVFHALAAVMVAFPLLVEATTRFEVLTGAGSALGIVALTAALLFVAWRRRMRAIAWITVVAALPTSLVLLVKTGVVVPHALYLVALGVATLWLGYSLGWTAIRWPVALAANLVVAGVTLRALAPEGHAPASVAMLLQWALVGAYVAIIGFRTLLRGHRITPFEAVQTAAALLIGFGGTALLTRAAGAIAPGIGIASVTLGAACYGLALANLDGREGLERNLHVYTTLALVLVLAGFTPVLRGPWLGTVFAALGVLSTGCWHRAGRLYLLLHGTAYLVGAGIVSGALGYGAWALAASPAGQWLRPGAVTLVVLVAAALCAALAAVRASPDSDVPVRASRLVIAAVLLLVASGWLVGSLATAVAGQDGGSVDLGALATLRTCVLAAAALGIAWIGRRPQFREWAWLVYPLLVAVGLKMVVQDFKYSRPATLFIALGVYGIALIVAPRLRLSEVRLRKSPTSQDPAKN